MVSFVLREFHIEGYINQYTPDTLSSIENKLVFVSESIENISPGRQARLTLEKTDENHFTELFELAAPNKEFETYIHNYWTRK